MTVERVQRSRQRSPEEQARIQAIRDRFQTERPTLSELVAEDGYNEPVCHVDYLALQQAIAALKKAREEAGLSLAQVAERSGIDKAALSRLETGRQINPTVATLSRYAKAVGKRLRWLVEDAAPSPNHVARADPAGSEGSAERAELPVAQRVTKRSPIVEAISRAYVEVRGPELLSTDRVIADPVLDARFLERCRQMGATGSDFDLNWRLFNARKAGHLGDIPNAKRFVIPRDELDQFLFASEMALRMLQDQRAEAGEEDVSLDRIICDPELAKEFDRIASRLAPGFSPVHYRWGALSLRKAAGRTRSEAEQADCPKFTALGPIGDVKVSELPPSEGLYLIGANEQPLFVGDTMNIRRRIERHLQYGKGHVFPDWLLSARGFKDVTLGVFPMPGSEHHVLEACDLKAKMALRPPLNIIE
jgi:transcriptional regulator with XRE-family HTH domain